MAESATLGIAAPLPARGVPWYRGAPAVLGGVMLALLAAYALLLPPTAGVLAPHLFEVDLSQARQAPSLSHLFGTDHAGRDLLVRTAQGVRVSLFIAVACTIFSSLIGVLAGSVAAAAGGFVDALIMRTADAVNALPHLLLGIVIVAMFRGSVPAIILSIAVTHWPQVARVVRAEARAVRHAEYVDAAYLAGASRPRVMVRHLLPAALGQAMVAVVLLLPHAIWHESTLSFLGLGLPPDQASLGTLLEQSRSDVMLGAWWTLLVPAGTLVVTTLAVGAVAGAARRRWAPRTRGVVLR